jgi:ParB family chromosome partitioning protein
MQVDIDLIDPSPFQPRTRFAEMGLEELAQSIRASGIIQPLVVRKIGSRYQLIAGERRWRAAQRAQLLRVPVVLREVSDEQALELTLVENIQREDLNPIEQARAFDRLMEEFHLTQDEVASRTGKDRATVANSVRLLSLEEPLLEWIEEGKITAGHGRALLAVEDRKLRHDLAQKASRGKLTVRQLERMATRRSRGRGPQTQVVEAHDPNRQAALDELQKHIGTRVTLHMPTKGHAGQLILEFYDEEQLNSLYDRLTD